MDEYDPVLDSDDFSARARLLADITRVLLFLGFEAHQKGYRYLREAVVMVWEKPELAGSVTKLLYPEIGRRFGTGSRQVERAIRSSIETAWDNRNAAAIYPEGNTRPTNSDFIKKLVQYVRYANGAFEYGQ